MSDRKLDDGLAESPTVMVGEAAARQDNSVTIGAS